MNVINKIALNPAVIYNFRASFRSFFSRILLRAAWLALLFSAASVSGVHAAPVLSLPIDCEPGVNCFIQNFVDVDPSPDYHDYTCGFLSYNDHKGTDFRLPDLNAMRQGVKVLAAAPGIVRARREGMPDVNVKKIDPAPIAGREGGNAVVIKHGDGWETQYNHMRRGSILVKAGDRVSAGQPLGLVGLSGNTEFPHVDFAVRHNGKVVDPFTGLDPDAGCGQKLTNALWAPEAMEKLAYQSSGILVAGFTDHVPPKKPFHEFIKGETSLPPTSQRLIFWVHVFGLRKGDVQHLQLLGPGGRILAESTRTFDRNYARYLDMSGQKLVSDRWPPGSYTGVYTLTRKNGAAPQEIIRQSFPLEID